MEQHEGRGGGIKGLRKDEPHQESERRAQHHLHYHQGIGRE